MEQLNRPLKGITSDLDHSYVSSNNWVFPTHGIRIYNRTGQGFVITSQLGNEVLFKAGDKSYVVAAEEHRGIVYLVIVNQAETGTWLTSLGCYPSPQAWWNGDNNCDVIDHDATGFVDKFSFLRNYKEFFCFYFITPIFRYTIDSNVKLLVDDAFDESANLYLCDGVNFDKIVNCGFTRDGKTNGITYVNDDFEGKLNHIPFSLNPPEVEEAIVVPEGRLKPGNYNIFFTYKTKSFDETSFFTGPQNLQIGDGYALTTVSGMFDKDADGNQKYTDKAIQIKFKSYDPSYFYITVSIIRFYNDELNSLVWEEYSLAENYKLSSDLVIDIDGNELQTFFERSELYQRYLNEKITVDHAFSNSRLFKANLSKAGIDKEPLEEASKKITIESVLGDRVDDPRFNYIERGEQIDMMDFQDPNKVSERLPYMEGESYPFGISFLMADGTVTETFPVTGQDGNSTTYDEINEKGLYRFNYISQLTNVQTDPEAIRDTVIPEFDLTEFFNHISSNSADYGDVVGFYIMRSKRVENLLYEGPFTKTAYGVAFAKDREHSDDQLSNVSGCDSGNRTKVNYRNATQQFFASGTNPASALHVPIFKNLKAKPLNQYYFPVATWTDNHPTDVGGLTEDAEDRYEYLRAVRFPWQPYDNWVGTDFWDTSLWDTSQDYLNQDDVDHELYVSDEKFAVMSPDFAVEDKHSFSPGQTLHMHVYTNTSADVQQAISDGYRPNAGIFLSIKDYTRAIDYKHSYIQNPFQNWYEVKAYPVKKGAHSGPGKFSSYAEDGLSFKEKGKKGYYSLRGYHKMGMEGSWLGLGTADARMNIIHYNRSYQTPPYIGIVPQNTDDFNLSKGGKYSSDTIDIMVRLYKEDPTQGDYFENLIDEFLPQYTTYWAVSDFIPITTTERKFKIYGGDNYKSKTWMRMNHHVDYDTNASKLVKPFRVWGRTDTNSISKEFDCELIQSAYCDPEYMHGMLYGFMANNKYNLNYRGEIETKDPEGNRLVYSFYPKISSSVDAMDWIYKDSSNSALHESLAIPAGNALEQNVLLRVGNDPNLPVDSYRKGSRVAFSDRRVSESFADGYRSIRAQAFQDFSTNFGHIMRIEELHGDLFTFRARAIIRHTVGENKLAAEQDEVISVAPSIYLSDGEYPVAYFGIQNWHCIQKTRNFIYGIDFYNRCIWRIIMEYGDVGNKFPKFENMSEKYAITYELDKILARIPEPYGSPIAGKGAAIGYNEAYKEVYFTFFTSDGPETLLFSERIDAFTGTSPLNGSLYIPNGDSVLYTLYTSDVDKSSLVYETDVVQDDIKFFDQEVINEYSFIVNGAKEEESAALFEKIFSSLRINAPKINLLEIGYETERQKGTYTFTTTGDAYLNSEYIEGDWNIPIIRDRETDQDIYEEGSEFRGRWLKITLRYKGDNEMYIRSLLTEFDISHA